MASLYRPVIWVVDAKGVTAVPFLQDRQLLFPQTGNVTITDKRRPHSPFLVCPSALNLEIEHAHAVARFTFINPAVACTDHDALTVFLLPTEINHRVRDRRIAFDRIRAL